MPEGNGNGNGGALSDRRDHRDYDSTGNRTVDIWLKTITRVGFPIALGVFVLGWIVLPLVNDFRENAKVILTTETRNSETLAKLTGIMERLDRNIIVNRQHIDSNGQLLEEIRDGINKVVLVLERTEDEKRAKD